MFEKIKENKPALTFSSFHIVHQFSVFVVTPFLSLILLDMGWKTENITYFFALFSLAIFLFSPIIGKISDIYGKKKIILLGLMMQMLFFLIYFFSENIYLIFFSRFFDGIAFVCVSVVVIGAFETMIKKDRGFWTGVFMSVGTIGALLGPVLAGYIAEEYFSKLLLIISTIFAFIAIMLLIYVPEVKGSRKLKLKFSDFNPLSEIKDFLSYKHLRGMGLLGILMNSQVQIYSIFFPIFVVTILELPKLYLGFLIAIPPFFRIFQFYYGKISDKISAEFGVLLGVSLSAGAIFFLPFVNGIYSLIPILIIAGIGGGIWNVNAWALMGKVAKKNNIEGEIVGTYFSISKLGVFFSTLISAYIIDIFGISRTLQIIAIFILIGNVICYFIFQPVFHHEDKKSYFHNAFSHK